MGPSKRTPRCPGARRMARDPSSSAIVRLCVDATTVTSVSPARKSRSRAEQAGSRFAVTSSSSRSFGPTAKIDGERHPLLLAAGQLERRTLHEARHAERFGPARDAGIDVRKAELPEAKGDLVCDGRVEEHGVYVLEQERDLAPEPTAEGCPVERLGVERLAGVPDLPAGGEGKAVEELQQRRLATAIHTEQHHPLATLDREGEVLEHDAPTDLHGDVLHRDHHQNPRDRMASETSRALRAQRVKSAPLTPPAPRTTSTAPGFRGMRLRSPSSDSVASSRSAWICASVTTSSRVRVGHGARARNEIDSLQDREGDERDDHGTKPDREEGLRRGRARRHEPEPTPGRHAEDRRHRNGRAEDTSRRTRDTPAKGERRRRGCDAQHAEIRGARDGEHRHHAHGQQHPRVPRVRRRCHGTVPF